MPLSEAEQEFYDEMNPGLQAAFDDRQKAYDQSLKAFNKIKKQAIEEWENDETAEKSEDSSPSRKSQDFHEWVVQNYPAFAAAANQKNGAAAALNQVKAQGFGSAYQRQLQQQQSVQQRERRAKGFTGGDPDYDVE